MSKDKLVSGSLKSKIVSSDLQEERDKCTFDQQELRVMLSGGQEVYENKMKYENMIVKH
jgi:hypothetical protein